MRPVFFAVYSVMAVWLLISAFLRVVLLLGNGLPLDPIPFISGGLAVAGLLLLLLHRALRRTPRPGPARSRAVDE